MKGLPRLRKGHSMFGWDWGPRIPDAGIWRKVSLLGVHKGRLESVSVTQTHEDGRVLLGFQPEILKCCEGGEKRAGAGDGFSCHITVTDPKRKAAGYQVGRGYFRERGNRNKGALPVVAQRLWGNSLFIPSVYSCGRMASCSMYGKEGSGCVPWGQPEKG